MTPEIPEHAVMATLRIMEVMLSGRHLVGYRDGELGSLKQNLNPDQVYEELAATSKKVPRASNMFYASFPTIELATD
jgi:hypothetical protein